MVHFEMNHMFILLSLVFNITSKSNAQCVESVTTASGTSAPRGRICSGDLIFEENFDKLDLDIWQHEQTLGGGGNWEFQWYTNNRTISYVEDNVLMIKPRLLSDEMGEQFLYSGTLDINGGAPSDKCTNPAWYGCLRVGSQSTVLNPIKSARIRTLNSFTFKYGKLETRIKLPAGDWLWPAFWLLPRKYQYGRWPVSGEIDIMESRGNRELLDSTGKNIGVKLASSTLHWGPSNSYNKYSKTHFEQLSNEGFDKDWHIYQMEWTPNNISFKIDNIDIGSVAPPDGGFWELGDFDDSLVNPWKGGSKMAPFDEEFYIVINLAVGGTSFFPDDAVNGGGKKPWSNKSPRASGEFWEGRNLWLPSWKMDTNDQTLKVDYVKVWAL